MDQDNIYLEISLHCLATCLKNFEGGKIQGEQRLNDVTSSEDVKKHICHLLKQPNCSRVKKLDLAACESGTNYCKDEALHTFTGKLHLDRSDREAVHQLLVKFCTSDSFRGIWLSFAREFMERSLVFDSVNEPNHKIDVNSFAFGTIVNCSNFLYHYSSLDESAHIAKDDAFVKFKHDHQILLFKFRVTQGWKNRKYSYVENTRYKLEIRYSNIKTILLSCSETTVRFHIILRCPPFLFKYVDDAQDNKRGKNVHTDETYCEDWIRCDSFDDIQPETMGRSNVLCLDLPKITREDKLCDHKIYCCPFKVAGNMQYFGNIDIHFAYVDEKRSEALGELKALLKTSDDANFRIRYAARCVESLSFQFNDDLWLNSHGTKVRKLVQKHTDDGERVEQAFFDLFHMIHRNCHTRVLYTLQKLLEHPSEDETLSRREVLPARTVMLRRVMVTPSRVIFLPKFPFLKSRFLNSSNPEFALRVQFRDDNLDPLNFSLNDLDHEIIQRFERKYHEEVLKTRGSKDLGSVYNFVVEKILRSRTIDDEFRKRLLRIALIKYTQREFLENCIKKRLQNGLSVLDRTYEYIGSSNSQLRSHSLFLYAKDQNGRNAEALRNSFGTINEKNVSKYVARLGLAMSQALLYVAIPENSVEMIEDVTAEVCTNGVTRKYTFSDGVGMISVPLAEKVFEELKSNKFCDDSHGLPSAFQIRLGGCKGMLTVNPQLEGNKIFIRPSMKKYESPDMTQLGIIKVSRPSAVYLNKPFVTLLEQLGTRPAVLQQLLSDHLRELSRCYTSEEAATKAIKERHFKGVSMEQFSGCGVNLMSEPYFIDLTENDIRLSLCMLKEKMRVRIPSSAARTMLGVLDETKTLEYGQVFLQPTEPDGSARVITGQVMVTKFPCMHPGDVRLFEAVDIEGLRHIKDCIVFPAKGNRPHPDEMAGSDLDGDEYAVIWDERLFITANADAMDYDPPGPLLVPSITIDRIMDFYVTYIKDFSVGQIASAHLAWADCLKEGIFDLTCTRLSEKHAVSVDFPKTGVNEAVTYSERVRRYPDFMGRTRYKFTYLSVRLLGKMYRKVCFAEVGLTGKGPKRTLYQPNKFFFHENWQNHRNDAEDAYYCYRTMMRTILNLFQLDSEATFICGIMPRMEGSFGELDDSYNTNKMLRILRKNIVTYLRNEFLSDADHETLLAKASAWYRVTYEKVRLSSDAFYGLPWVVADHLVHLAQHNFQRRVRPELVMPNGGGAAFYPNIAKLINEHPSVKGAKAFSSKEIAKHILLRWFEYRSELQIIECHSDQLMKNSLESTIEEVMEAADEDITTGIAVLKVLKKYTKRALTPGPIGLFDVNTVIGYAAVKTLHECFKSCSVEPIVNSANNPSCEEVCIEQFHVSFGSENQKWQGYITHNEKEFFATLKALTSCKEIYASWNEQKGNWFYYRISAVGSRSSISLLRLILSFWVSTPRTDIKALARFLRTAVF